MASGNIGAALEVFGRGLTQLGGVRIEKEERDLEAKRREAIEKLKMEHDVKMQSERFAHDESMETQRQAHNLGLFAANQQVDLARDEAREAGADRRLNIEVSERRRDRLEASIEAESRRYRDTVSDIDKYRQQIKLKMADIDPAINPDGASQLTAALDELDALQQQAQQEYTLNIRRIRSGNYGRVYKPDEVRSMLPAPDAIEPQQETATPAQPRRESPVVGRGGMQPPAGKIGGPPLAADSAAGDLFAPVAAETGGKRGAEAINQSIGRAARETLVDDSFTGRLNKRVLDLFEIGQ